MKLRAAALLAIAVAAGASSAQEASVLRFTEGLSLSGVAARGRVPLPTDALLLQLVAGRWSRPAAGDELRLPDGELRAWQPARASDDGSVQARAGYLYWPAEIENAGVFVLAAQGHGMVYVNGEPRAGDPYGNGSLQVPVAMRAGINDLLFLASRGNVRAELRTPRARAQLDPGTWTLPDLVAGSEQWGAIVVANCAPQHAAALVLRARLGDAETITRIPPIPPLALHKTPFALPQPAEGQPTELAVELLDGTQVLDRASATLAWRSAEARRKVTFRSGIDGSVQYYALNPATAPADGSAPALILSLHGAGVEASGQAAAYGDKSWAHLVAPTNRRPFGFDWEDWGRKDALEVLEQAMRELRIDAARVYLTGHSMGGHGTWHLGATFPDRFAAIGPSAGWISFQTYAGGQRTADPSPMQAIVERAANPSDTLALKDNLRALGAFVLHGDADDNVPVAQARRMREELTAIDADFGYHEQPGAGHWWDDGDAPGTGCVDFAPMLEFFVRRRRPSVAEVQRLAFTTVNPGISASCHWASILAQREQLAPSRIELQLDAGLRRVRGTTHNVAQLALALGFLPADAPLRIELDGDTLTDVPWPAHGMLWLERGESWQLAQRPPAEHKGPHRYGPFKEAFDHRALLVYGTAGTPAENAWALAKARFDAETFYYRGNGAFEVVPDVALGPQTIGRNVILYGNADTNAAWQDLLGDSPVQVRRGAIVFGERRLEGEDLACLFVRPRPSSTDASVGVVAGAGLPGMRLTERLPYFVSGIAYPDVIAMRPDVLESGAAGVELAGFFGLDWSIERGEFAHR